MKKIKILAQRTLRSFHKMNSRKKWLVLSPLVLIVAAGMLTLIFAQDRDNPPTLRQRMEAEIANKPLVYENTKFSESGPCANKLEISVPEQAKTNGIGNICLHGEDILAEMQYSGIAFEVSKVRPVECFGDGQTGRRAQAVYAYYQGSTNNLETHRTLFNSIAGKANYQLDEAAKAHNYRASIRWVTDENCNLDIIPLPLPTKEVSVYDMIDQLSKITTISSDRNYLIWSEFDQLCGLGMLFDDTNPDPSANDNNRGAKFSRVDRTCWNYAELHELLHNFGAVQFGSPNNTGLWHCTDERDIMCYDDGGAPTRLVCDTPSGQELVDCNNDDYFHPSPEPGSYLGTHWNVANNSTIYLYKNEDTNPPTPPAPITATRSGDWSTLSWGPSVDEESGIDVYNIYMGHTTGSTYDISSFDLVATKTADDRSMRYNDRDFLDQYSHFYIVAYDKAGNQSNPSEVITLNPAPPPSPNPIPPPSNDGTSDTGSGNTDTSGTPSQQLKIINLRSTEVAETSFRLLWDYEGDSSIVTQTKTYINGKLYDGFPAGTKTQWVVGLQGGIYETYIEAVDSQGGVARSSPLSVTTLNYKDPSDIANLTPYNLEVINKDSEKYYIRATINSTGGIAYRYNVSTSPTSDGQYTTWLSVFNFPRQVNFLYRYTSGEDISSFNIVVFDKDGNIITRSESTPNPFP